LLSKKLFLEMSSRKSTLGMNDFANDRHDHADVRRGVVERAHIPQPLALLLILCLIVLGSGYAVFERIYQAETHRIEDTLAAIASLKSDELNTWMRHQRGNAHLTANASPIADRTRQWLLRGARNDADYAWLRARLESLRQIGSYGEMALLDLNGKVLVTTDDSPSDLSDLKPMVRQMLESKAIVFGNMRWDMRSNGTRSYVSVPIATPLVPSDSDRIIGVLLIQVDTHLFLNSLIQKWPTPSQTAETVIVQRDGGDILFLNEVRHQRDTALKMRIPADHPDCLVAKAVRGEHGLLRGIDYRGVPVIGYGMPVPATDWFMVVKIDDSEVYASIRRGTLIVIGSVVLLLLASCAALYWWWRQRSEHLRGLQLESQLKQRMLTRRFDSLIKLASDAILLIDENGIIVEAYDRAESMYGYARGELIGKHISALLSLSRQAKLKEQWAQIMQQHSLLFEGVHVRKDGSEFPVEVNSRTLESEGRLFVQSIVRDITERKRADEALRQSEARFRQLADAMPQLVWTAEPDGRVTYCNARRHEYAGWHIEDQRFEWTLLLHPDDADVTFQAWWLAMETGQTYQVEHRLQCANGGYRWHISRGFPVRDDQGGIVRWYGTATDVHELKLAKQAYRASEERLRLAQQVARMGAFEWDALADANAWSPELEMVHGLPPKGYPRTRDEWLALVHPNDRERVVSIVGDAISAGEEYFQGDWRIVRPDGAVRWISGRAQIERDDAGRFIRLVGINMDSTEQKQAELHKTFMSEQLQLSLDSAGMGWWRYDRDARMLRYDRRFAEIFGFSEEQAVAEAVLARLHPDDRTCLVLKALALLNRAQPARENKEYRIILPDGSVRWIESHGVAVLDTDTGCVVGMAGTAHDITERKKTEDELTLAAAVYQDSSEAMMVTDERNDIIAVNRAFRAMTGYEPDEVIGRNPRLLRSGMHDVVFYQEMWRQIVEDGSYRGELWNRKKDGEPFAAQLSINTIAGADGAIRRYVGLLSDITEKKRSEDLIWSQANFDALTGLPNRRLFRDRLEHEVRNARRSNLPLAVMFMDLDGFKSVNDALGHAMGDLLLKEAAQRLRNSVRESDTVARLGGDEFTVILTELHDPGNIERVARHILRVLSEPVQLGEDVAYVSASIGITVFPDDADDIDDLIKNADQAMYSAKEEGKNGYRFFTPAMQEVAMSRSRLINDMRGALDAGQLEIEYQPIVEMETGTIRKAEALIRWQHPDKGRINPIDFISAAEDTGMIVAIGNWVFLEAARQSALWREKYHPEFQISINVSPVQFKREGIDPSIWLKHLKGLGLPGRSVVVEITEGVLLDANDSVRKQLLMLREAGIEVALDDFGVGYSSLSYVKKFDIDYIKIDQSFVHHLSDGSDDMALCEAIITMAHKLGIRVIAEGVETPQQHELLVGAGCDFAQGFFFSRPASAEEFEQLLKVNPFTSQKALDI
jgi:diguanylate cyclase (GGDEF)-like protein/PAS domain S-box-containing protein